MNTTVNEIAAQLKRKLIAAALRCPADGILFSGGLDSGILACISPGMKAITVTLESYGPDIAFAEDISKSERIPHYHKRVAIEEALQAIPELIGILESFDPAIPNDLAAYFGLQYAKELGLKGVMTGDGADELFAGYSFMEDIDDLTGYIKKISPHFEFSSNHIGKHFGLSIYQPFIDKDIFDFALNIDPKLKVKKERDVTWGKWILRYAFADVLPCGTAWQTKRPLEVGSGMSYLRSVIESMVSDKEFNEKRDLYGIKFFSKEHLYYYKIFRKEIGLIPPVLEDEKQCRSCGAGIPKDKFHCRVCGWVEESI
jgi:asparagine synthase (glutamine-hydrolysing)